MPISLRCRKSELKICFLQWNLLREFYALGPSGGEAGLSTGSGASSSLDTVLPLSMVGFFRVHFLETRLEFEHQRNKGKGDPMASIINSQIPEFSVEAFHDGKFKKISNADLKGKWSVFFFYPADFTFVCPTELGDMADKYDKLKGMGVEVYSVSTDTHFVHKAWHDASDTIKKIKFPMLADPTGALSKAFGVYIDDAGLAYRGSFVVNPEGKIKVAEYQDNGIGRNAEELVRKIQAAQFIATHDGEVCPAKWTPGAATLKPGLDLVGKI
jgi:peroxiredoxin (alkyl hydroperoxide reductase subunit C)